MTIACPGSAGGPADGGFGLGPVWARLAVNRNATRAEMLAQIDGPDVAVSNPTSTG